MWGSAFADTLGRGDQHRQDASEFTGPAARQHGNRLVNRIETELSKEAVARDMGLDQIDQRMAHELDRNAGVLDRSLPRKEKSPAPDRQWREWL